LSSTSSSATSSASSTASSVAPIQYDHLKIPGDADVTIQQPTEDVVQFTWIISKNKGNNEYHCKLCNKRFVGQPCKVYNHFQSDYGTQRVISCLQSKNLPELLKDQLQKVSLKRSGLSLTCRQRALPM
jgi:hypothetical protein